ncbi:ATP-binding cassette domain-containing protein [Adlercreutzia sp. R21]|uniref:ATP-binding cassette domain-containing protein n=1 Tax=Adlercreutzia wanghongyangiae TaxID=3111451 RepID=UPI002DC04B06|nr:ATP-binding cassette domain-containing protein [Adlercreutzia sp. R21]MEC4183446.1 ATP-binding cassette domain-containing protein [Adlercreutzia sp. R21]
MQLNLSHISYTYPGAALAAVDDVTLTLPQGWTGVIGDNGAGKSTLAHLATGDLAPDAGLVGPRLFAAYCAQDSSAAPDTLYDFAADWGRAARRLREALALEEEWLYAYDELSGGQRKRVQVACALWQEPDVLVMDEPTNDLDAPACEAVACALELFGGIGLLISHDRALLDRLAAQCVVVSGGRASLHSGGFSQVEAALAGERAARERRRENARREVGRLAAEARRRGEEASRAAGKRSRAQLDARDSDGRERIGRAIVSGKDGVAGKLSATMDRRLARASERLASTRTEKRYTASLHRYGAVARIPTVAHLPAETLRRGDFCLHVPELWVGSRDRIALTGRNGAGKSVLTGRLLEEVPSSVPTAYLPQEVGPALRERALAMLHDSDRALRGRILSLVGSMNTDPDKLLDGHDISPGELRKIVLAGELLREPALLVLDEPTNHLDIGSILALQELLESFPGALVLVTHDAALSEVVAATEWHISRAGNESALAVRNR